MTHDAKVGDLVEYKGQDWKITAVETAIVLKSVDSSAKTTVTGNRIEGF
jgi:hypothetical protein